MPNFFFQSSDDDDDSLQLLTSTRNRAEQMVNNPAEINHDLCSLGIKAALHWDTAGTAVKNRLCPSSSWLRMSWKEIGVKRLNYGITAII